MVFFSTKVDFSRKWFQLEIYNTGFFLETFTPKQKKISLSSGLEVGEEGRFKPTPKSMLMATFEKSLLGLEQVL